VTQKDPSEFEAELAEKVKFSSEPIKSPLHKFITVPIDLKSSVEAFTLIMSYMGDYPSKKGRDALVQALVAIALKSSNMYDEIYCQIMKQLTFNTSEKSFSAKRGWDLLSICLGSFPPTNVLIPTIIEFIDLHKSNPNYPFQLSAKEAADRLDRAKTKTEAFRLFPPSLAEVLAAETGTPMSVTIYFPGHITRTVKVDPFTTAGDVVSRIAGKVQLIQADEFGLFIYPGHRITGSDGMPILNKTLILDVLSQADKIVKEVKQTGSDVVEEEKSKGKSATTSSTSSSASSSASTAKSSSSSKTSKSKGLAGMVADESGNTSTFTLVCKKKIWKSDDQIMDSDFLTNIIYAQVKKRGREEEENNN